MKFKFFWSGIFVFVLICSGSILAAQQELLKLQDIHKIMDQILSQHAEKNKMSAAVIKNSLKMYIDQFDPYHTYFLEGEINPFLHLSSGDLEKIVVQYNAGDFSVYERLNDLIKKAILRSRLIRQDFEKKAELFFQAALKQDKEDLADFFKNKAFAENEKELKTRIKEQLTILALAEAKRYGEAYVLKNPSMIMETYEKRLKAFENQYLFDHGENQYLAASEKENLFVMHILKSLAGSLDAHTEFYSPGEAYELKMHLENSFQGVGLSLQDSPEGIIVSALIPGTPAAKSGLIKTDDQILAIDGKNISEETVDRAAELLQGKAGTTVTLLIKRKVPEGSVVVDKELTVKLNREPISIDEDRVTSSFEHFGNGIIGKIRLNTFYQNGQGISSEKDMRDAIEKLEKSGNLRGLVLDLRENTGGFLSQAVKVAGLFITNGVVVISKYSNGEERVFRDLEGKLTYNGPLVILTSKMTASAAEIVAEALQDYGVAIVVGDQHTYGKGTVQTQTVTQDKASSYFKVTIGKYYTVSGKTPQINGVIADVVVPGKYSNERIGEAYLGSHTLKNDRIAPSFDDKLEDIEPDKKAWYLHYYVPTEQKKVDMWRAMIPTLKKNSHYRLSQNKNYQAFIKQLKGEEDEDENETQEPLKKSAKNFGDEDLQMMEAVNILKDMIYLEPKAMSGE